MRSAAGQLSGKRVIFLCFFLVLAAGGLSADSTYARSEKFKDINTTRHPSTILVAEAHGLVDDSGAIGPRVEPWWLQDPDEGAATSDAPLLPHEGLPAAARDGFGRSRDLGAANAPAPQAAPLGATDLETAGADSREARIAAYKAGLTALYAVQADLELAEAEYAALPPPMRPPSEIRKDLDAARADVAAQQDVVARVQADLDAAGGADAGLADRLKVASGALNYAQRSLRAVRIELADAAARDDLSGDIERLRRSAEATELEALRLLEAAANKPLTNEVIAEVNRLLGLENVVLIVPDDWVSTLVPARD